MTIQLGENIKRLRKERNITQEKLAEYLNVSYQTVSKWENGITMPSVMILPSVANVFGVSIDELYDPDKHTNNERIQQYEEEYAVLCSNGDNEGRVELMRKALAEFPRNYVFMNYLARSLYWTGLTDEVFTLCERILDECMDETIRLSALQTIARAYSASGQQEKAMEYALKIPSAKQSREILLAELAEGEEQKQFIQKQCAEAVSFAVKMIFTIADDWEDNMSFEERIEFYKTGLELYNCILDDNRLWINVHFYFACSRIAGNYCLLHNKDKAMEYILLAEKYAVEADRFFTDKREKQFTSKILNGLKSNPKSFGKHWSGSHCRNLYQKLQRQWFDEIRDDEEFKAVEARLGK